MTISPGLWWNGYVRLSLSKEEAAQVVRDLYKKQISCAIRKNKDGATILLSQKNYRKWRLMYADDEREKREVVFPFLSPDPLETRGAPKLAKALFSRPGMIVGSIIAVFLFCFFTSLVWEVRVVGTQMTDEDLIITDLEGYGLSEGASFSSLNLERIATSFAIDHPSVAWISIRRRGVIAEVECLSTETGNKENRTVPKNKGANLVASQDAVIEGCEIEEGHVLVKPGQIVAKGEILVSGVFDAAGKTYLTYAQGRVMGRVSHRIEVRVPYKESVPLSTGRETVATELRLWGWKIRLRNKQASPAQIVESKRGYIFGVIRLPVEVSRQVRIDTTEKEIVRTETETVEVAYRELQIRINALLSTGELVSKKTEGYFSDDGYVLICEVTCIENIADTIEFYLD